MTELPLVSAVNVSEGRDRATLEVLAAACGESLLDLHADPDHHRSVLTLGGPGPAVVAAVRSLVRTAVDTLDLSRHRGAHPRFGVVDVVPFAPVGSHELADPLEARDTLAVWAGATLGVPCFLYGPMPDGGERSLPEVRRGAFDTLRPDTGPDRPHPRAGAMAVGARRPLVAYNLWVDGLSVGELRAVAAQVRSAAVRTLALALSSGSQVSCNLVEPELVGPAEAYDRVAAALPAAARIRRAEVVGLVPRAVLERIDVRRFGTLGLRDDLCLEARMDDPSLRTRRP